MKHNRYLDIKIILLALLLLSSLSFCSSKPRTQPDTTDGEGGNSPPVAIADNYSTYQDVPIVISSPGILNNDSDTDNNMLIATLVNTTQNGTLALLNDGGFTYSPSTGFLGIDSFSYRANDGIDDSSEVEVSIEVIASHSGSTWDENDFLSVYDVGDGYPYSDPSEIPWEILGQSTLVRIHWRATPYNDKWAIKTAATLENPLVILGVPNISGDLPIIEGDDSKTRSQLSSYYWNQNRSIIKIDGPSTSHIYIENLEIRGGNSGNSFTDTSGQNMTFSENAASIHISSVDHVTIRGCVLHDSGNGIFSGFQSSNVSIIGNYIYGNGSVGIFGQHNSYTESNKIIFEANRYGPLRVGANGNNLKDRSAGTIIRYNWIESGSRQLDLVDAEGHPDIYNSVAYSKTFVYGNILIEPQDSTNGNVIHYGGDSGQTSNYRKGTLYLYNNTVISYRTDETRVLGLSTNDEAADVRNNIFFSATNGNNVALLSQKGMITMDNNILPIGWRAFSETSDSGTVEHFNTIENDKPGFLNISSSDFRLQETSPAIDMGVSLHSDTIHLPLSKQYVKHSKVTGRATINEIDIGAFER